MYVDTLNTINDSVVFGSVALMVCIMVIIIAFLNSDTHGQNEPNATQQSNQTNEPEVVSIQPTATGIPFFRFYENFFC